MRFAIALAALAAAPAVQRAHTHPASESQAAVQAALAEPSRADQTGDDDRRQAAAVLTFAGVGPGDSVVDFIPGNGYWTRILSSAVGPAGHVYTIWPSLLARYAEKQKPALEAKNLANVTLDVQPTLFPTVPQPVDLFWTVHNYHDLPATAVGQFNAAVFKALKPGGIYVVIDHADARGAVPTQPFKHRIDPGVVKSQVQASGFRFVASSPVLANPADDHSKPVFDPSVRGRTDQFVYKFRKP
jgi:predicted methyltransferase